MNIGRSQCFILVFRILGGLSTNLTKIWRATGTVLYARIYDEETTYGMGE